MNTIYAIVPSVLLIGITLLLIRSIEIQRIKIRDLERHLSQAIKDKTELFTALRRLELEIVDRRIDLAAATKDTVFTERRAMQMRKEEKE
jgi:hypothetical protein